MIKLKVAVRDLRVGDILQPTGRLVTHGPNRGVWTPKGKHDLQLEGKSVTFGSSTLVSILRDPNYKHSYIGNWNFKQLSRMSANALTRRNSSRT